MPVVRLEDDEQLRKAFRVLIRVGGTFHGRPERILLVTDQQYKALIRAGVIRPNGKARTSGQKAARKASHPQ
jgi:hypothetical protein